MRVCAAIGRGQQGVVTRSQLLMGGVPRGVVDYMVECGFLHRLYRGVYVVGHLALAPFAEEQAAVLACGEGAVLSHRSALRLWGVVEAASSDIDVTVRHHCRGKPGIRVHRVPLGRRDVRTRHGLLVTSPAVSLIGFARHADLQELEDAVAEARVRRLIRDGELEAAADRLGRRSARLRAFLEAEAGPAITRSRAERRFRTALREAGIPQPTTNARVAGYEVDFLWENEKVVLEVDGYQFHGHRRAFERDRKKAMIVSNAGYHVSRVTVRQFSDEVLFVIAHVARTLGRRGRVPG